MEQTLSERSELSFCPCKAVNMVKLNRECRYYGIAKLENHAIIGGEELWQKKT
jgi:hypothetical protein